jgi:heme A synthase
VTSHFLLMVIFALLVSTVFAALLRDEPRQQVKAGARMFAGFVLAGFALGWLVFPFPL